jgi:hypothetical protein
MSKLASAAFLLSCLASTPACASFAGTNRRTEEPVAASSSSVSSVRVPSEDRLEIGDLTVAVGGIVSADVTRVQMCRVARGTRQMMRVTTTQQPNRAIFGVEVAVSIVGAVIIAASASAAAKACGRDDPDTCDIGKAYALSAGVVATPFVVSTIVDLALSGTSSRIQERSLVPIEHLESCGSEPAAGAQATLVLPDGSTLDQESGRDGRTHFRIEAPQLARFGPRFEVEIEVEGRAKSRIVVDLRTDVGAK